MEAKDEKSVKNEDTESRINHDKLDFNESPLMDAMATMGMKVNYPSRSI